MSNKIQTILGVIFVLGLVGGAGYYIYTDIISRQNIDINKELEVESLDNVIIEGDGDYTVEIVPVDNSGAGTPVPNLDREIVFSADILAEKQDKLRQTIEKISSELKEDSNLVDNWVTLGSYRKTIGDYDGAIEAWEYALVLQPKNSITLHNLGDLYGYYLNNPQKAEEYFIKALEIAPDSIYLYFKMAEFYNEVIGDAEKARAIVQQGVDTNPGFFELKELLDSL